MDLLSANAARAYAWTLTLAFGACVPDVDTDDATVTGPSLLAIQAEPAEAKVGEQVVYRGLFKDTSGGTPAGRLSWFYCSARKPAAELGPVSRDCFDAESDQLHRIGNDLEVQGTMPIDGCSLFGPNPPLQTDKDAPAGRPADPDPTGGYKQPVIVGVAPAQGKGGTVLYEQRLLCGLAGVSPKVSGDFNQRYRRNVNPRIDGLDAARESGARVSLADGEVLSARAGETLALTARWPSCPREGEAMCGDGICGIDELSAECKDDCAKAVPPGCAGQEDYLWLDVQEGQLGTRHESISVAWYATAGVYADERTGVPEAERSDHTSNEWTAPHQAGEVTLWTVIRDSRGGVGFREIKVNVGP